MMNDIPDLITVAKNGNLQQVENLLRQNFSVHIRGKDDETALYWSSCRGHVQICKALLDSESDVNARVAWGSTALHAAADRGHIQCVDLLIRRGANVNIQNKRGDTPLHVGAYRGHIEIVRLLVRAQPDLFIKNDKGRTAADEAEGNSHHHTSTYLYQQMLPFNQNPFSDHNRALPPPNYEQTLPQRSARSRPGSQSQEENATQGQWYASLGSLPAQGQYQNANETNGGMEQVHSFSGFHQYADETSCNSFPGASPEKGKVSDSSFLRYRDDLKGFRRRTEPEESMDEGTVPWTEDRANKENSRTKLCRRESINGQCNNINVDVAMRYKSPKIAREGSDREQNGGITTKVLSEFQPCNPPVFSGDDKNGGLPLLGSCDDVRMSQQCLATSVRPSRISVGCVREVVGNMHNETIENFSETLQMELFKKQEMVENLQKENANLQQQLTLMKKTFHQFSSACQILKHENAQLRLSHKERTGKTHKSPHSTSQLSLSGFIHFLDKVSRGGSVYSHSDQMLLILKESLYSHWLKYVPPSQLDVPNKEWLPGKDFTLIGEQPMNQLSGGTRDGCCSLVFQIKHKGQTQILKMMINLINLEASSHGQGYSMEHFLANSFGPEHQLPVAFNDHVNVIKVRHSYTGQTNRFQKYLGLIIPTKFDIPIEMASRTTFIVFDHFPESLKSMSVQFRSSHSEPSFGLDITFVLQLLYQILSAVYYIQKNGVIHRDIKADNVFLDNCLRPVLADFGMARTTEVSDSSIYFTNSREVYAGNAHAWAPELTRWSIDGPPRSIEERMLLKDVYSKSDAYAVSRMFYCLLRPQSEGNAFPQSSRDRPHYENSEIPELPSLYPAGLRFVLRNQVLNDPLDRMTDRRAMLYVGMLMFPPSPGEVTMETQTARYCQARILKLLSLDNSARRTDVHSGPRLTMLESVDRLMPELEADFLHKITPEEFWEIYQDLKQRDYLSI
ncbi:uncharacterized protein LOC110449722 [Mizuhopecten yessoensis]|uniref:Ankyrin repeat domain-containing protein 1 n=1 Tax=Mizuhopecten yessoensis TaxID=6573 RepID=A0A210QQP8_MIZYE|nr:uncharacterized protein LOC110449722 [Mizuhopecten yessoensis]XP_021352443.1 uncharacterized protein LOC110449722 [Mizuhopecten yessoensis]XP_021352444.1 uncharacterized protein LOC110449722 [Mizuhopecten yessoensis]XP_021352445.1 uncharacterized protein LOC110449722 [Mizuhopecten yessoensis]OWF51039.1 Ankyrin repeat domain-containing protein 1 [Mizuhopecten yessoensis]